MQYAADWPQLPSARTLIVPLVALLMGAAGATGAYALIDGGDEAAATKVVVVETPARGVAPSGIELRGSKASSSGLAVTSSDEADVARRTDPHGVASSLRGR